MSSAAGGSAIVLDQETIVIRKRFATPGDRRNDTRYEISLPLQYRLNSGRHGAGQSTNISREGLAFSCGEELPEGEPVEMDVNWPVLAHDRDPMVLRVHGLILRSSGTNSSVSIVRREFRIVQSSDRNQGIAEAPCEKVLERAAGSAG